MIVDIDEEAQTCTLLADGAYPFEGLKSDEFWYTPGLNVGCYLDGHLMVEGIWRNKNTCNCSET